LTAPLSRLRGPLASVLGLSVLAYGLILHLSSAAGIKSQLVIRDLAQTCSSALGVGLVSSIGYLLWMASASAALLAFTTTRKVIPQRQRELLGLGGWMSLLLCIDDMFLLHDRYIGPTFLYGTYAIFAILILLRYKESLVSLKGIRFLASACFLGISVIIDFTQDHIPLTYETTQIFEEGAKFLGISTWLLFWWQASSTALKRHLIKEEPRTTEVQP